MSLSVINVYLINLWCTWLTSVHTALVITCFSMHNTTHLKYNDLKECLSHQILFSYINQGSTVYTIYSVLIEDSYQYQYWSTLCTGKRTIIARSIFGNSPNLIQHRIWTIQMKGYIECIIAYWSPCMGSFVLPWQH